MCSLCQLGSDDVVDELDAGEDGGSEEEVDCGGEEEVARISEE